MLVRRPTRPVLAVLAAALTVAAAGLTVTATGAVPGDTAAANAATAAQAGGQRCDYRLRRDVPATMRDGTVLRADVYTPTGNGDWPVLLMRLPYDKAAAQTYVYAKPGFYASHCYVVVIQDVRGQYASDGDFYTFANEATDGYDTIEWAADLPHANGKVGMYGFSYVGATQWLPATLRPPSLVTIVPAMTSSDYYDGWTYEGGALNQSFVQSWPLATLANSHVRRYPDGQQLVAGMNTALQNLFAHWYQQLPLDAFAPLHPDDERVAPYYYDWLDHPGNDGYWKQWSIRERYEQVNVPALNFDGWYDIFLDGSIENFTGMRQRGGSVAARAGSQLVVGPWDHLNWGRKVGALDFGPAARNPIDRLQLRWFDSWLKNERTGVGADDPVRVFVMGANRWRTGHTWPLPGADARRYHLDSAGNANTLTGTGLLTPQSPAERDRAETDSYRYDPRDPVPSFGGRFQSHGPPPGPQDQRLVQHRPDVLVYDTPVLREDTEVTGPIEVTLYASSSAPDTDWTAKLSDVYPDGRAMLISHGIQRARYRLSQTKPTPIEPGRVYKYTIEVWPTANLFKAGHQIRLEVSSSNFPMHDANPNTGGPLYTGTDTEVAHQTIHHDAEHPSSITLPVMTDPLTAAGTGR